MFLTTASQLNRPGLESTAKELEVIFSSHLQWLSSVNEALFYDGNEITEENFGAKSYKKCRFGRWYYNVADEALRKNESFRQVGMLHKNLHLTVYDLLKQKIANSDISQTTFKKYINLQRDFLSNLLSFLLESTESLGKIDFLTGLPNRLTFHEVLNSEKNRIARHNVSSTIAIADIDHFKKINDTYGHAAGDYILTEIAKIFQSSVRSYDTVARYGGEEFVFCFPEANRFAVAEILERIRHEVQEKVFRLDSGKLIRITCSFGLCEFSKDNSVEASFACADKYLYLAKEGGRNRVCFNTADDEVAVA